jgi:hypothetical protein
MRFEIRGLVLAAAVAASACAGTITPPSSSPSAPAREALLVLPGFGYTRDGERAIKALAPAMRADSIDLYVPAYVSRTGLDATEEKLRRFIREQRLERYGRVHVFAFLAGGWTLNSILQDPALLPNLATVVYDRSPYQERAPRIAADKVKVLAWLRYGPVLFDFARSPYHPLPRPDVAVGLLVETAPTSFVRKHHETARSYGPFTFECAAFSQPHDDCVYVAMNHTELYRRFAEVWPGIHTFIRDHRFPAIAQRTPPSGDPLAARKATGATR